MNVTQFQDENYNNVISILADSLKNNRLISVFGTGLTAGEPTSFGKYVMLGQELQDFMIIEILKYSTDYEESDFKSSSLSFYEIADIYFEIMEKYDIDVKAIFKEYFTNVKIDKNSVKYNFLNLPWKTIYTLNVDDAIENHTEYTNVISPDMEVNNNLRDYKSLIKLHGDAKTAICQSNQKLNDSIVFSKDAYLKAVISNKTVLGYFVSEMSSVHTLYYGCSFKTLEFDIETIIANDKSNILSRTDTKRFFVTTKLSNNKFERRKLENDFLVTDVIELQDRRNYEIFMQDLVTQLKKIEGNFHGFEKLLLKTQGLSSEQANENKAQLLMIENHKKYSELGEIYLLPFFTIDREQKKDFLKILGEKPITLLRGPRFCGKTLFLLNTFKNFGTRQIYFFSSTMILDTPILKELIQSLNNSVLVFDTNSFSDKHLFLIKENFHLLASNNIKLVLTFNASNNITYGLFNNIFASVDFSEIELTNIFTNSEIQEINLKLNDIPLPEFINKINTETDWGLKKSTPQNLLDNIVRINMQFHHSNENYINWKNYNIENEEEFGLLIMLLISEKVYTSQFYILYNNLDILQKILKKYSPFIEEEYVSFYEHEQHSGHKIIKNCHYCIKQIVKQTISSKQIEIHDVVKIILNIITKLYKSKNTLYKEIMLFDNLNDIFDGKEYNDYANQIIENLYENLEKVLTDDKHYWLQRAKSILYISNYNINKINKALEYSTKVFLDCSDNNNERIKGNASMTSAMLYGRLVNLENYTNTEHIEKGLFYYIDTLTQYHWNTKYVQKLLSRKGFNDLKPLLVISDASLSRDGREKIIRLRKLVQDITSEKNTF